MRRREDSKQMMCQCSFTLGTCGNLPWYSRTRPAWRCAANATNSCIPSTHHCQMESWNSVWDGREAQRETVLFSHPHCSVKQPLIHAPTRWNRAGFGRDQHWCCHFTDGIEQTDLEELPKIYQKCQSTCRKKLRPDKNLEELNTWPLSSWHLNVIGFKVRRDKSCQFDLL